MSWRENEWFQCEITEAFLAESPVKGTKSIEITATHAEHGEITGNWWLTNTTNQKGVPNWKATFERLLALGCDDATLRDAAKWIDHIAATLPGKAISVMPEQNEKGYWRAKFMGVGGGSGSKKVTESSSPFVAGGDDEMPF